MSRPLSDGRGQEKNICPWSIIDRDLLIKSAKTDEKSLNFLL